MSILSSKKKKKYRRLIYGGCNAAHILGWLVIFPSPLIQFVGEPVLDFLIGTGISFGVGLAIQKAMKC